MPTEPTWKLNAVAIFAIVTFVGGGAFGISQAWEGKATKDEVAALKERVSEIEGAYKLQSVRFQDIQNTLQILSGQMEKVRDYQIQSLNTQHQTLQEVIKVKELQNQTPPGR